MGVLKSIMNSLSSLNSSFYYRVTFIGELLQHSIRANHKHFNEIIPGLLLGGLPLTTEMPIPFTSRTCGGHAQKISQQCQVNGRPLALIISALEEFELNGYWPTFSLASTHQDWENASPETEQSIEQIVITTPDLTCDFDYSQVLSIIEKMNQCIMNQQSVFVHCKAGKGRSWAIVAAYLATHYPPISNEALTPEQALNSTKDLIQSQRPQVNPSTEQEQWVVNFITFFNNKLHNPSASPRLPI